MTYYKLINSPSWQSKRYLSIELLSSHLWVGCEVFEVDDSDNERLLGVVTRHMLIALYTEWIQRVLVISGIIIDERMVSALDIIKGWLIGNSYSYDELFIASKDAQYALNRYNSTGVAWPSGNQEILESLICDLIYAVAHPFQKRVAYSISELASITRSPAMEKIIQGERILAYFKSSDYLFNLDKS